MPEYYTTIWVAMGDIMNKWISHGAVMQKPDVDALMKELYIAREANLLTVSIETYFDNAMVQSTSAAA